MRRQARTENPVVGWGRAGKGQTKGQDSETAHAAGCKGSRGQERRAHAVLHLAQREVAQDALVVDHVRQQHIAAPLRGGQEPEQASVGAAM